ncbi:MAG: FkbM family methyltransferase [Bacteroidota bacterium]
MIIPFFTRLIPQKVKKSIREKMGVPSQEISLTNIKRLGFSPKFCLDIGAYEGYWTGDFKKIFPGCAITMIEGQSLKEPALIKVKNAYSDVNYKIALLGAAEAAVNFNIYESASSVLVEHFDTEAKTEQRNLLILDKLLEKNDHKKPDFIKIDTQGYELEILKGGEKALAHAEFVLLEVSLLDIYVNSPLVIDVLNFMKERGFVLYDICTLMKRPLDNALFQSDFLFVKENSQFRNNKHWA